jgi:hypothetical protein
MSELLKAFWQIESYIDSVRFLEEKECQMVEKTPLKELPLLIGDLEYESSKSLFEERLKNIRL